ncbi:MAG: hypothetical protein IID37_11240 [Planctomycetes bacterium]|nr:hypothetical protein [Planctomycetota bacterium]
MTTVASELIAFGSYGLADTTATGSATSWHPTQTFYHADFNVLRAELAELTPSNDKLLRFAQKHPPDMSWWAEAGNAFESEEDIET